MPKRVSYDDALDAFIAQSDLVVGWARSLTTDERRAPSTLPGWTIGELVVHLSISSAMVAAIAEGRAEPGVTPLAWYEYVGAYARSAESIADRAREEAQSGSDDPAELLAHRTAEAIAVARQTPAGTVVQAHRGPLRFTDLLVTRVIELVVHTRDLGRSLPERAPSLEPRAVRLITRSFAEALAARHPGRAIELRVPPYAAVQLIEGGSHTRGTPPNVVETDPGTFIDLASGRISFAEATEAGSVRASGIRADLTTVLPILR